MKYIVLTSEPEQDLADRWNACLARSPFATHYTGPNYFTDPYVKGERFAVLAVDGDRVEAVLTGTRQDQMVTSGLFSRPQMVYRDGCDRSAAATALLDGIRDFGGAAAELYEIYSWQAEPVFAAHGLQARISNEETSVVMLDLAAGADAVFAKFSQTRRNEIRKALKQDVVEIKQLETDGELDELYTLHREWNKRKGNTPDSFDQMKIAAGQTDNRRVFIAKCEGHVIAASFYRFCPGGVVEYAANFSEPQFQKLRPNDLIGWHAIRWACSSGFSHFSMGGSHLFLRRFGGEIIETTRYRLDRSRFRLYEIRENARDLGLRAFKHLPQNVRSGMRKLLAR